VYHQLQIIHNNKYPIDQDVRWLFVKHFHFDKYLMEVVDHQHVSIELDNIQLVVELIGLSLLRLIMDLVD
jgi:hypothetical protein